MELLLWIADKATSLDPKIDAAYYKAGDVICIKPDGSDWGYEELNRADWRLIRVSGMNNNESVSLTAKEIPEGLEDPKTMRRRGTYLDLSILDGITNGAISNQRKNITRQQIAEKTIDFADGAATAANVRLAIKVK